MKIIIKSSILKLYLEEEICSRLCYIKHIKIGVQFEDLCEDQVVIGLVC